MKKMLFAFHFLLKVDLVQVALKASHSGRTTWKIF